VSYLQLAENVWNADRGHSQASIVYNWGRGDDPEVVERLRRLAKSILRRCSAEEIMAASDKWRLICAWPYGDLYVLESVWKQLGIDTVLRQQASTRQFGFDVERALSALVANRACAPASKLYCHEQWLKEDAPIEGTQTLELHHLYRAMDFLEANQEAIEQALLYRVADLLNLDVALLFYDTPSLHFEIDEEDGEGSPASGKKCSAGPRKRGYSKNGRGDAPQIIVGLAVTREGFPVRHWVFPGNTVDVSTVTQVKETCAAGSYRAASSSVMPVWSPRPTYRHCPGAAANTCWPDPCGEETKSVGKSSSILDVIVPSRKTSKSKKSLWEKANGNDATPFASIHRKPSGQGRIEKRSSPNLKPNSKASPILPGHRIANELVPYVPAPVMDAC
jgi:hypothetical protein